MKKSQHLPMLTIRITLIIVGLACILVPAARIHKNLKTDNLDGRGRILLTEDCRHVSPGDGEYECKGTYQQGSGMVSVKNAVVQVTQHYYKGEYVEDIYRDQTVKSDAPAAQQRYMSGSDRRNLLHNLPLLVVSMSGLVLVTYSLLLQQRTTRQ